MNLFKLFYFTALLCITFLLARCSPALIANVVVNGPKIAESADARGKAKSLKRNPTITNGDSIKYARYYIYRSGSFVGCALSCLIYDNNEYVGVANVRTFEKVDYVIPGDHVFTSEIDSEKSVKFHFNPGKTYIIKAFANTKVQEGVLVLMNQDMIKHEIAKGNFFNTKFLESGLKVEEISYQ